MKLTYFKYHLFYEMKGYHQNLLPILQNFVKIKNVNFRTKFKSENEESLFLFPVREPNLFLFVVCRNKELIKKITADSLKQEDIYKSLHQDEKIGFASYIFMDDMYYGIASTFLGPKNGFWLNYLNNIIRCLGIENCKVKADAFPTHATKEEIVSYPLISKTTIHMTKSNKLFQPFIELISGMSANKIDETNTIIIELRPAFKSNMNKTANAVLNNIDNEGIKKLIIKAKPTLDDMLTDFYLVGNNSLSDYIENTEEKNISSEIISKVKDNFLLKKAIEEFLNDSLFEKGGIESITKFNTLSNWDTII